MKRIAVIDMGTNTFHLLIAEISPNGYRIVHRQHEAVKIGLAGINQGVITDSACSRAIEAMKKFSRVIAQQGVDATYAYGTSAFRNARNGATLSHEITSLTGIPIKIISGDDEADYIFSGVKAGLHLGTEPSLVMDIGAGSVEFIIGNHKEIHWKQSVEIGGQRLLEKFQKHDPISAKEIVALDEYFTTVLKPLQAALNKFQPGTLVGSSGTFDTLSDIYCIRSDIKRTYDEPETPLSIPAFYQIYDELIHKDRNERMKIPGMIEMRVDMIVVSCCLIRYVLQLHPFEGIRVSSYSLKEGVLASYAHILNSPTAPTS